MKKNLTELVLILDKSGSMHGLEEDTIGGCNAMLDRQRAEDGECVLTTVLFNHRIDILHDRIDIRAVNPVTEKDYRAGGSTALYDAVGTTIQKIDSAQRNTREDYRADKVMFVIITDGFENTSRLYNAAQVKSMIAAKKECGWEFIFLGANIDAAEAAGRIGIDPDRAADYVPDAEGTRLNFETMSAAAASYRAGEPLPCEALNAIRMDKKKRGKKS